ncbi:aldose epimerase family protein [Asaia sp. VD9]|uniref:aldose epimerase family protein n=1 Tax=Asaia sp. VD9 TaxID=3081235 RepID=UPI00301662D8
MCSAPFSRRFLRRKALRSAALALAAGMSFSPAMAATMTASPFGKTSDGKAVSAYTLKAPNGLEVTIMTYGGVITRIMVPDRAGKRENVVLGYATLAEYEAKSRANGVFFGALIGRFANRIAKGRFTLDGHDYTVPVNNGPNSLHGGKEGFDRRVWSARDIARTGQKVGVALSLVSPDGDQGYPGALHVTVTYTLDDQGTLGIEYKATTTKPTVLNLTNHSYFNLAGAGSQDGIFNQMLQVNARAYTPTDATLIPTGAIAPVAGTPFDFTTAKPIGRDIRKSDPQLLMAHGYDHNWVIDGAPGPDGLRPVATLWDPGSGRSMSCASTEPGVQIYTSNFLDGSDEGNGLIFRQSDAVTFETQHFPDSPNQPKFPSTRLDPGQTFHSRTVFRFGLHDANNQ